MSRAPQVAWAEGPGASGIEAVYGCSGALAGDAVVVFLRALCAVSQEELAPARPGEAPRCEASSVFRVV